MGCVSVSMPVRGAKTVEPTEMLFPGSSHVSLLYSMRPGLLLSSEEIRPQKN